MTSDVGDIRLLESLYGPCGRFRYHEYKAPKHQVLKDKNVSLRWKKTVSGVQRSFDHKCGKDFATRKSIPFEQHTQASARRLS
jgi:hypothetical protein